MGIQTFLNVEVKIENNMPKGFEMCRKKGGRIRTKKLSKGRYMHVCLLNGKSYAGEVKKKK